MIIHDASVVIWAQVPNGHELTHAGTIC